MTSIQSTIEDMVAYMKPKVAKKSYDVGTKTFRFKCTECDKDIRCFSDRHRKKAYELHMKMNHPDVDYNIVRTNVIVELNNPNQLINKK